MKLNENMFLCMNENEIVNGNLFMQDPIGIKWFNKFGVYLNVLSIQISGASLKTDNQ